MDSLITFTALLLATLAALFASLALDWLLLRGLFRLMQPATANRRPTTTGIVRGTQLAARAWAAQASDRQE